MQSSITAYPKSGTLLIMFFVLLASIVAPIVLALRKGKKSATQLSSYAGLGALIGLVLVFGIHAIPQYFSSRSSTTSVNKGVYMDDGPDDEDESYEE